MKRMSRVICTLALLLTSLGAVPVANAALNPPAGTIAPNGGATNGGFPMWYQDKTGLTLSLCLDQNNANCLLPFPIINLPAFADTPNFNPPLIAAGGTGVPIVTDPALITPQNFPVESFYWSADSGAAKTTLQAVGGTLPAGKFRITMQLFAGFATINPPGQVVNGQQTAMMRVNVFKMLSGLVPGAQYTITLPFPTVSGGATLATIVMTADANGGFSGGLGGQGFRAVTGAAPNVFSTVIPATLPAFAPTQPNNIVMDNFMVCAPGTAPQGFIGAPLAPCSAVFSGSGAPATVNIAGPGLPAGGVTITQFGICGKLFGMDINPATADFGNNAIVSAPPVPVTGQTFVVSNVNSVSSMTIGAIALTGPNAADFVVIPAPTPAPAVAPCAQGAVLPVAVAGTPSSCSVTVAFVPKPMAPAPEVAVRTATVNIGTAATPTTFSPVAPAVTPTNVPPGLINLSGTAQYSMSATVGANGTITPQGTAIFVNAGANQTFTIQPNAKFQVKDITVNGALAHFNPPAKITDPVTFSAPAAAANGATVNATFMPSGDLDGNGTLDSADTLKALRIFVGLQTPAADDLAAMKVTPLDAAGRPNPTPGAAPDLNDVVMILKRGLGIVTW